MLHDLSPREAVVVRSDRRDGLVTGAGGPLGKSQGIGGGDGAHMRDERHLPPDDLRHQIQVLGAVLSGLEHGLAGAPANIEPSNAELSLEGNEPFCGLTIDPLVSIKGGEEGRQDARQIGHAGLAPDERSGVPGGIARIGGPLMLGSPPVSSRRRSPWAPARGRPGQGPRPGPGRPDRSSALPSSGSIPRWLRRVEAGSPPRSPR